MISQEELKDRIISANKSKSIEVLRQLSSDENFMVKLAVANNPCILNEEGIVDETISQSIMVGLEDDNERKWIKRGIDSLKGTNVSRVYPDYSEFIKYSIPQVTVREACKTMNAYKDFASWAIWSKNGSFNPESEEAIKTGCVIVAYNPSCKSQGAWASFHKMTKDCKRLTANDNKIKEAIQDTDLSGCYMTDIIKSHVEANSNVVKAALTQQIVEQNVDLFLKELSVLKPVSLLVAIGNDTFSLLVNNPRINKKFKIIKIPHYSARKYNNGDDYKSDVRNILVQYGLADI